MMRGKRLADTSTVIADAQPSKKMRAVTSFERKVYDLISTIPKGKVTTYGTIAKVLGCRSSQAVGQALKRNPFAPTVPCHRVVASDLRIGGFQGCKQGETIDKKLRLLNEEGVRFVNGELASRDMLWTFTDTKDF
eukprot:TRINITY_DN9655_c0_g1_i1.p2 TRINITY_DN9655_c0_g1~~TRINITY_DN9655_c0_g1_i1.p2  ORF type:complete len:135 (-),score=24.94 TRINITY_DN9655_c0_g1_i1:99-503(-)